MDEPTPRLYVFWLRQMTHIRHRKSICGGRRPQQMMHDRQITSVDLRVHRCRLKVQLWRLFSFSHAEEASYKYGSRITDYPQRDTLYEKKVRYMPYECNRIKVLIGFVCLARFLRTKLQVVFDFARIRASLFSVEKSSANIITALLTIRLHCARLQAIFRPMLMFLALRVVKTTSCHQKRGTYYQRSSLARRCTSCCVKKFYTF